MTMSTSEEVSVTPASSWWVRGSWMTLMQLTLQGGVRMRVGAIWGSPVGIGRCPGPGVADVRRKPSGWSLDRSSACKGRGCRVGPGLSVGIPIVGHVNLVGDFSGAGHIDRHVPGGSGGQVDGELSLIHISEPTR